MTKKTSIPSSERFLDRVYHNQRPLFGGRSPSAILLAARELLLDRDHWTQKAMALNARGNCVGPRDLGAVCWSLDGAIVYSCNTLGIAPPWLLYYLDQAVIDFCAARQGVHVTHDSEPNPLAYFADSAHYEVALEFLQAASVRLQAEGK